MKKSLVIILGIAGGVCLIAAGILLAVSIANRLKFKNDSLEKCTVSTGGGMLGGSRTVTLRRERDGSVTLSVSEKETHNHRERTTTYAASEEALAHVKELANSCNLYGASKRRYSNFRVLDGDTTSVTFDFASDDFRVSEEQVLTPKMQKGFDAVIAYLNSLAVGEGVESIEPQTALLYLKSGYTLQFIVEDAFDSKLDELLGEEREVCAFFDSGIILAENAELDCADAPTVNKASAGTIVYDPQSRSIVLLYTDRLFDHGVYVLACLDGYVSSACPLIAEMEGMYRLYLNE